MFWCYLYFGQFSSVICLFLCVFQSQTLIFLILVHLMFINFLLPWIHRNFVFVPYFSRRSWFRWRIFGPGRTSLVRWMFFSMLRSTFIISVDQVFSPFSSVELPYFDEFIVFPSLLSSKLLISVTDFFLVIFGRNFQFRWIVFSMCIPSLFQWTVLVEIPCFSQWIMFFRPRFGRNYFLFLSHPYFGQNCPFFRCIFLFSAYSHRNFGQFFVLPLIPVEIPFFVFFLPPFSRQNSVLIGNIIFSPLTPAKILFFSEIYFFPVLFKPKFDEIRIFLAIYLFPCVPVEFPYCGDLFFRCLILIYSRQNSLFRWSICYFVIFPPFLFFLQFLGKTPK
jgi:hypothetical protein